MGNCGEKHLIRGIRYEIGVRKAADKKVKQRLTRLLTYTFFCCCLLHFGQNFVCSGIFGMYVMLYNVDAHNHIKQIEALLFNTLNHQHR